MLQTTVGYLYLSGAGGTGVHQNLVYNYDQTGNITAITDNIFTGSRSFAYDALSRLTQAVGYFGTNQAFTSQDYIYNSIGNILQKGSVTFTYADAMHPSAVTSISSGKSYAYDANGNMTTRANQTLVWDIDNRVSSIAIAGGGSVNMQYDYTGTRVRKDGTGTTVYPFSGYEIDPSQTKTKFIRIGIETFASKKTTSGGSSTQYFYHNDHLGSVNVITDSIGNRVQLNEYDPWGGVSRTEGTIDPTHRFNGKELDPESGLYYYGGRYYDAEISRFVSPDPYVQDPDEPQNLNRYAYTLNDPINFIDPDGFKWYKIFARIFVGLLAGAGAQANATAQVQTNQQLNDNRAALERNRAEVQENLRQLHETCEDCAARYNHDPKVQANTERLIRANAELYAQIQTEILRNQKMLSDYARGNIAFRGFEAGAYAEVGFLAGGKLGGVSGSVLGGPQGFGRGLPTSNSERIAGGSGAARGLTTPSKYFGSRTKEQAIEALTQKFGPPKSSRPDAVTFYNNKTKRSFNVHQAPGHMDGKPHVDIRRRGDFEERKYILKESE